MHRRLIPLLVALLALAVAAPLADGQPTKIDGRHQTGPRRTCGRARCRRTPRRAPRRARRRAPRRSRRRARRRGASSNLTGVYNGETSYPPPSFAPDDAEPYVSNFVLRVNGGRITGFVATVRMECPEIAVLERHISHIVFRGPLLAGNGGLTFVENGMRFSGHVGANSAGGSVSGMVDGCFVGSGATWKATKRQF